MKRHNPPLECRLNQEIREEHYALPGIPELNVIYRHITQYFGSIKTPPGSDYLDYQEFNPPAIIEHVVIDMIKDMRSKRINTYLKYSWKHLGEPRYSTHNDPKEIPLNIIKRFSELPLHLYAIIKATEK